MACEVDANCSGAQLCYSSSFFFVDEAGGNICDCNAWFGWTGDDCLESGPGTYVLLTSAIVTLLLGILCFVLALRSILYSLQILGKGSSTVPRRKSSVDSAGRRLSAMSPVPRKSSLTAMETFEPDSGALSKGPKKPKKKVKVVTSMNITILFCFLSSIFYIAWRISVIVLLYTPDSFIFREEEDIPGLAKAHTIEENVEQYLILAFGIFLVLGGFNLSLVWIDNSRKIMKLVMAEDRVIRYKYFLFFLDFIWIVLFLVLPPVFAGIMIIIIFAINSVCYFLAARYMQRMSIKIYGKEKKDEDEKGCFGKHMWKLKKRKSIMEDQPDSRVSKTPKVEQRVRKLVRRMKIARRRIIIGSVIGISGNIYYAALAFANSWRAASVPREVSRTMVGTEMLVFGLGFNLLAVVAFLHETAVG